MINFFKNKAKTFFFPLTNYTNLGDVCQVSKLCNLKQNVARLMKFSLKPTFALLLSLMLFSQHSNAQQNLTVKSYGFSQFGIDYTVLDGVFGTVTGDGVVRTVDGNFVNPTLPYTLAEYAGVDLVITGFISQVPDGEYITQAQADALINYVKGGGVLIGSFEGTIVYLDNGQTPYASAYIGSALLCNAVTLNSGPYGSTTSSVNVGQYHPGNGALLLNSSGASSAVNTGSWAEITGVPSENIIYALNTTASCGIQKVLDFVVPAYPGAVSACGVNGFAIISGDALGPFSAEMTNTGNFFRNNSQANINYAQFLYNFLYGSVTTNRAWSTISTNNNTTCPPAVDADSPITVGTPAAISGTAGATITGNAPTGVTGGTAPYTYSDGTGDALCTAPTSPTLALPTGKITGLNASTGAHSVNLTGLSVGTYEYCIKICDASGTKCAVSKHLVTVTAAPSCNAGTAAPSLTKN